MRTLVGLSMSAFVGALVGLGEGVGCSGSRCRRRIMLMRCFFALHSCFVLVMSIKGRGLQALRGVGRKLKVIKLRVLVSGDYR